MSVEDYELEDSVEGIAIIGMAGRFPGADNVEAFWQNLIDGVSSISTFTDEECIRSGVPEYLLKHPNFVRRGAVLTGPDLFDARFFGYSPREASYIDPQQRIFLECSWEALENAGYDPEEYEGTIGVYAGCGINNYLLKNLLSTSPQMESVVTPMAFLGNEKDFLTTRVSYLINLTGPSIGIQTACSTSLVTIQLACQGLLTYQCDMALSGGISLQTPRMKGYLYTEGQILSSDGYCRAFDKDESGTVFGEGVGVVVLKRLEDAIKDRDTIYAVIKGIAVNNDGSDKVGYTAPSVNGQAAVIAMAQALAGVDPDDISYIEAHGTGTLLGDPIEVAALTQVFRESTDRKGFCAIGSVKPNIGHLDVAAGIAGLIKTALAIRNKKIPASLFYHEANPELKLETSPFYVNDKLSDWRTDGKPLLAGLSSFGIGGTNSHAILSEAPKVDSTISFKPSFILVLSAKTETALAKMTENLSAHFRKQPNINLADAAYTLQTGRRHFKHRRMIVCENTDNAIALLESLNPKRVNTGIVSEKKKDVVFMFTGQGSQYVNMAKELYRKLPVFKEEMDRCADILFPFLKLNLKDILYPDEKNFKKSEDLLKETSITQPVLFSIEYALAKFWIGCGVLPGAMIGHSIGEYVAACISGVFTLNEALELVAMRGQLMQNQERGSMLAILLPEEEVKPLIHDRLSMAAVNSPSQCVVSGTDEDIEKLKESLSQPLADGKKKIRCQKLETSHAYHSWMMEPAVKPLKEFLEKIDLHSPEIPFISNVTGTWITGDQVTDPAYWSSHLRHSVRFSDGIKTLISESDKIMLELGPGMVLTSLARLHFNQDTGSIALPSVRRSVENESDYAFLLKALGYLWIEGEKIDWKGFYRDENRMRIPLPAYPFERESFWINASEKSFQDTHIAGLPASGQGELLSSAGKRQSSLLNVFSRLPGIKRWFPANVSDPSKKVDTLSSSDETDEGEQIDAADDVEKKLARLWKKALGVKTISRDDDFYDLGGHSLIAAQLFAEIEVVFGKSIPLSTLFHSPTIAKLADVLRVEDTGKLWSSLIPIRSTGSGRPIYLVHGAEGNVLLYRSLAQYLGEEQPIYGLQSAGLDGKEDLDPHFQNVAARYVEEIKKVQPEGPYNLGGYCLGGTIALEMAQQLIARGDRVNFLGMIEIYNIQSLKWPLPLYLRICNNFLNIWYHFLNLVSSENDMKMQFFMEKFQVEMNRFKVLRQIGYAKFLSLFGKDPGKKFHHLRVDKEYDQALEYYFPEKYPGKITVFGAKTLPLGFTDPDTYGFGMVAEKGVDMNIIPVYPRGTLLEPYVQILAEKLANCLQRAEEECRKSLG